MVTGGRRGGRKGREGRNNKGNKERRKRGEERRNFEMRFFSLPHNSSFSYCVFPFLFFSSFPLFPSRPFSSPTTQEVFGMRECGVSLGVTLGVTSPSSPLTHHHHYHHHYCCLPCSRYIGVQSPPFHLIQSMSSASPHVSHVFLGM